MRSWIRKILLTLIGLFAAAAAAAALIIAAVIYLLRGLAEALMPLTGPAGAYALTGTACLLLILIAGIGLGLALPGRPRRSADDDGSGKSGAAHSAVDVTRTLIRRYPLEAAGIALVAGYAAEDPEVRRLLLKSGQAYVNKATPTGTE